MSSKKLNLLNEYVNYLRDQQCLSEETIYLRRKFVEPFLNYLGKLAQPSTLSQLSAKIIHDYILVTVQPLHRGSKRHVTTAIRSFLRFAHIKGYLKRDLIEAVPVILTRKLDSVPQNLPWEDIQKLLTLPDRSTRRGRRDYAVLSLLIHYGVRINQVTTLRLQDIFWQEGSICFAANKHSNAVRLPLHKDVAEALLAYIKNDRMTSGFQEVFLTVQGLIRPLSKYNHYYYNIKKYFLKAGIVSPIQGSRVIRHSFATHLVNQNISIKTISDLLGHQNIDSTFIYTKVNVVKLRELAREWPEVLQ